MKTEAQTGVYIYGILPGDVELQAQDAAGVGDPPAAVRLVRYNEIAALVSDVDVSRPLGQPDDLMAHEELLDSVATDAPVLPLRFGAVVASEDAVTGELLEEHYEELSEALQQLDGIAQYVVKGRYTQDAILREILEESPEAADLAQQLKDADPDASRNARIELGEIINNAVAAKREEDTRAVGDALEGVVAAIAVRDPSHDLDAVHLALLVEATSEDQLLRAVRQLADDWEGRIDLRLLGPMAAYDFVAAPAPPSQAG